MTHKRTNVCKLPELAGPLLMVLFLLDFRLQSIYSYPYWSKNDHSMVVRIPVGKEVAPLQFPVILDSNGVCY